MLFLGGLAILAGFSLFSLADDVVSDRAADLAVLGGYAFNVGGVAAIYCALGQFSV